jgi:hypothetical protein
MRFGFLLLALFVAVPVLAEPRSETIHLDYLAPDIARAMLFANTTAQSVKNPDAVDTQRGFRFLLPDGISAIAANPLDHTLTVAGEPDAIQQVKRILRLLDVPPRRVRLSAEVHRLKPGSKLPVKTAVSVVTGRTAAVSVCENLTDEQVGQLRAASEARLLDVSIDSINREPIFVFPRRAKEAKPAAVVLLAGVNGDGTISLKIGGKEFESADGMPGLVSGKSQPGSRCLLMNGESEAWIIHAEILPDRPGPGN